MMTGLVVDILLYILILAAILFGGISVMGLVVFPDPRSRAFTGIRAGILAMALVSLAGICYGMFSWFTTDGMQYVVFTLAAILLFVLVVFLNRITAPAICRAAVGLQEPEKRD